MSESVGDVTRWLSYLGTLRYAFLEKPSEASRNALLVGLEGYQVAASRGMSPPAYLPAAEGRAGNYREWWELQMQEAIKPFLGSPSASRLEAVKSVTLQYIDFSTKKI